MNKKTLKKMVRYCLMTHPATRNCDIRLTKTLWKTYYPETLSWIRGKWYLSYDNMDKLPRESAIVRIRANFQNKLKIYIPTDKEVAFVRGFEEDEWMNLMGYNSQTDLKQGQKTIF